MAIHIERLKGAQRHVRRQFVAVGEMPIWPWLSAAMANSAVSFLTISCRAALISASRKPQ
jgi:hypothetical protein